jgi:hypothetical protein
MVVQTAKRASFLELLCFYWYTTTMLFKLLEATQRKGTY